MFIFVSAAHDGLVTTTNQNGESTMMNIQEREEAEFGQGPRLWDAGEGVCCAAYQLGACEHTEVFDPAEAGEVEGETPDESAYYASLVGADDEPF